MSPNQPKTPISGFRLDERTRGQLRRTADAMNVSMTEAVRRAAELMDAMNKAFPEEAAHAASLERLKRRSQSEEAVAALAAYLIDRDWPNATPRQRGGQHGYEYQCRAAAILNGEAWAIRKTWPKAANEIATRSDWSH